ncbi:prostaglandin E2 receptor EP2 subtype-like [Epinephelus fuscoguttatus]|uniref:prostaglandin E2 receptor EP2 subtype-like n=1 Tax=Epinephelus fuscoguttatus TaxID=293821 RepID=UPI0020D07FEA|nr:prostaglandin E2 receptor EP2 subtype-like [Epinephelus fuscoguttatus]
MANHSCYDTDYVQYGQPITSGVMFSSGVLGNIVALVLLELRRKRTSPSLYRSLVTALLMTDLFGSISVSPIVLTSYARNTSLVGMNSDRVLCSYFGFSMTFLSLSTLAILCALALERYISIGHPYFYERHLSKRFGYITIPLIYLSSILFCVVPFFGFGKYVQYCPGTWCFLKMSDDEGEAIVYIVLYASFILIMMSSTVACNVSVIIHLVRMHRKRKGRSRAVSAHTRYQRSLSMAEEVEHLLPLAIITVVYICCTFPLVLRVYINLSGKGDKQFRADLRALRLLSCHTILNPWVFIFLRPTILRVIWRKLRKPHKSACIWGKSSQSKLTEGTSCCAAPEAGKGG